MTVVLFVKTPHSHKCDFDKNVTEIGYTFNKSCHKNEILKDFDLKHSAYLTKSLMRVYEQVITFSKLNTLALFVLFP